MSCVGVVMYRRVVGNGGSACLEEGVEVVERWARVAGEEGQELDRGVRREEAVVWMSRE